METPYIIRYLDEQYVRDFFNHGDLMLSSFTHLKKLEDEIRKDGDEGMVLHTGQYMRVIGDISNRYLVLCTSLSISEKARCEKKAGVLFLDVNSLCGYVRLSLIQAGFKVRNVYCGPCNYFGRDVSKLRNPKGVDPQMFIESLNASFCKEDMFFMKPASFSFENEYRIIFELENKIQEEFVKVKLSRDVIESCRSISFENCDKGEEYIVRVEV